MALWCMCSQCVRYSKEIERLKRDVARLEAEIERERESQRRVGNLLFQQAVRKERP